MTTILSAEDRLRLKEAVRLISTYQDVDAMRLIDVVLGTPPTETEEDRELRRLAETASEGPWEYREVDGLAAIAYPKGFILESDDEQELADKKFIAKANPKRILSLLDRLAGKEK